MTNTIAVINPFKTLQKPLEAILKPSKGFSLSATHPKSENAVKGKDYENYRFKIIRLSNPRKKKRIKLYTSIFV